MQRVASPPRALSAAALSRTGSASTLGFRTMPRVSSPITVSSPVLGPFQGIAQHILPRSLGGEELARPRTTPAKPANQQDQVLRRIAENPRNHMQEKWAALKALKLQMNLGERELEPDGFREAVSEAKRCGVAQNKVTNAEVKLQEIESIEEIDAAREARDLPRLRRAVNSVHRFKALGERNEKEVFSTAQLRRLDAAQETLETLEAEEMLKISMRNGVTGHLKKCIDMVVFKKGAPELVEEARIILKKSSAERELDKALRTDDVDKLEHAMEIGKDRGLPADDISYAQFRRDELKEEARQQLEREQKRAQPDDEHETRLRTAISLAETGALTKAIFLAKRADEAFKQYSELGTRLHTESIAEAEQLLGELEVLLHLPAAIKRKDRNKLREVLEKANDFGMTSFQTPILDEGQRLLSALDAEDVLTKALSAKVKDKKKIADALQHARDANSQPELLHKAERFFAQLQVRSQMHAAIDAQDEHALLDAIRQAAPVGLPRKEIIAAETIVAKWAHAARKAAMRETR
eukprot:TRINITY_DN25807_c0_g2_i1.p1 TRINITY_DN25807_c0_g2~~TRINITY_DN25807_c0_g2_i1.p1  ORF type:complete len:524 (+),score=136.54 TRINITY_DN25807_c0_g2_i1:123-1694(+)